MFKDFKVFETELAGRPFIVETGKMCGLSSGSCLIKYGETTVLVNATASASPRDGIDFFPLSVDFEEKLYAVGKIPGSFMKREGRPSDTSILSSRVVDRSMRPLFPDYMRNDVSIVMTVMSVDQDCSPEIAGLIGASIAVSISNIPFNGPIAGVSVGYVDGEIVINPNADQKTRNKMEITVAGTLEKIVMLEAGGEEIPDDIMVKGIEIGHSHVQEMVKFINKIQAEIGKEKFVFESQQVDETIFNKIKEGYIERVKVALDTDDKIIRDKDLKPIMADIQEEFSAENAENPKLLGECMYQLQKMIVRQWLLEGKRVDGRELDEIRPLDAQVELIPRVHGSGMFTRGQTQVLSIATLGAIGESQKIDGIDIDTSKRYMHHYNFPSYSVGETRPSRGPGRREIGHGALAEKALVPVLPSEEDFPYAIRVVSEVLSSNGSTSQGAICGSTLALLDAGVPLKTPVAGISCGLITSGDDFKTMVDIQGLEDFFGDMDFKVGGTKNGVTAVQVDIKVDGLTMPMVREAFEKTQKARMYILNDIMNPVIAEARDEVSEYAPKMVSMKIHPDKIREVIGSGGKVIQKICADCEVKIDIEDDGKIFIGGVNAEGLKKAKQIIENITMVPEIGAIYKGKVIKLMPFGVFVEISPGKEGLVHISKLAKERVEKVEDIVAAGDEIMVKVTEIDDKGRINLSRKDAIQDIENAKENK